MEKENPNYYAILTADVRYDKKIRPNARLLFAEITALCNKEGYCWATNKYFANLYGVGNRVIQVWLSQLIKRGYIRVEIKDLCYRKVFIVQGGMNKCAGGYEQKCIHNTISNTKSNNNDFAKAKSSLKTKKMENEIIEIDEDGHELVNRFGKKKGDLKTTKNKDYLSLVHKFYDMAEKEFGVKLMSSDTSGYFAVAKAMKEGGLTKEKVLDLYEWWFGRRDISNKIICSLTACLSPKNINYYKLDN